MKKEEERNIYAVFDDKTIRVYQAYNNEIADEALKLGKFGSKFSLNRMTWIKPSFLWMMYRSGWATKQGQERILAIDLKREGFDEIVKNSVLSSFREVSDLSKEEWKEKLENSEVRCQWDPDRDIYGNPIGRRAIQLGIKGETVKKYINEWIVNITDITEEVFKVELFQSLCFLKRKSILENILKVSIILYKCIYKFNNIRILQFIYTKKFTFSNIAMEQYIYIYIFYFILFYFFFLKNKY